ncbi:MAG: hypothetical protein GX946_06210 [Oligosphaeraceae bacterium]|nr:hypothetical protein [Oligosphaeraceae bacterium]
MLLAVLANREFFVLLLFEFFFVKDFAGSACQVFPAAAPFHLTAKTPRTPSPTLYGVASPAWIAKALNEECWLHGLHVLPLKPAPQKTEALRLNRKIYRLKCKISWQAQAYRLYFLFAVGSKNVGAVKNFPACGYLLILLDEYNG